jgi:purine catabolism regulator
LNLEPGELVLLSTETLRMVDERLSLDRVIESLAGVGVGAVGVQGEIDKAAIRQAQVFRLPLLALPEGARLLDIEREVTRLLIDREAQLERRAQQVADELAARAAENRGLEAILEAVTQTTGKVAAVHDTTGRPLAHTALEPVGALAVSEAEAALALNGSGVVVDNSYIVPLDVEGRRAGYLTIVNGGVFDELDQVTAERGALVCAMELAKQKAVVDAETRARGDWMQQWLNSDPNDEAYDEMHVESSAEQAGIDLSQPYMAVLYRADSGYGLRVIDALRQEMDTRHASVVIGPAPGGVLMFYPAGAGQRALQVAENIRQAIAMRLRIKITGGVGRPAVGLKELRRSYRQAERARIMGAQLCNNDLGCLLYFGDLSLYQLLLSIEDQNELQRFCDEILGAVLVYDDRHDGELVRTLEAFFANNGNLARTADALCVHRNTLSYRLSRVSDITAFDLDDAETRLMLHLALKVLRVLQPHLPPESELPA